MGSGACHVCASFGRCDRYQSLGAVPDGEAPRTLDQRPGGPAAPLCPSSLGACPRTIHGRCFNTCPGRFPTAGFRVNWVRSSCERCLQRVLQRCTSCMHPMGVGPSATVWEIRTSQQHASRLTFGTWSERIRQSRSSRRCRRAPRPTAPASSSTGGSPILNTRVSPHQRDRMTATGLVDGGQCLSSRGGSDGQS